MQPQVLVAYHVCACCLQCGLGTATFTSKSAGQQLRPPQHMLNLTLTSKSTYALVEGTQNKTTRAG